MISARYMSCKETIIIRWAKFRTTWSPQVNSNWHTTGKWPVLQITTRLAWVFLMDSLVLGFLGRQWPKIMPVAEVGTSINVIRVRMLVVQNHSRTRSPSVSEVRNYSVPNYTQTTGLCLMVEARNLKSIYPHNKHIWIKFKPRIIKVTPLEAGAVEPTGSGRMTIKTIEANTCEENLKYSVLNRTF